MRLALGRMNATIGDFAGNGELVFDGGSMALEGRGRGRARSGLLEEDFAVVASDGTRVTPVAGSESADLRDDAEEEPLESLRRALARHLCRRAGRGRIPSSTLEKTPSAELRPDQTDRDSLPPDDLFDRAEYERQKAAPGRKVSTKSSGSGRLIPIAQVSKA